MMLWLPDTWMKSQLEARGRKNPKRDGLGTISTLGAIRQLSSVSGDGGAVSPGSK